MCASPCGDLPPGGCAGRATENKQLKIYTFPLCNRPLVSMNPNTLLSESQLRQEEAGPMVEQEQPPLDEESRADGHQTGATMHGWTSDRSSSPAQAPRSG